MAGASHHLAIYNFGIHVAALGDPAIDGFVNREPLNFEAANRARGFVARSGYDGEPGPKSWGVQVFPRFLDGSGRESGPSSLSLWDSIESLMAFSYSGIHAEALKHARRWNVRQQWPPLVLFWLEAGQRPEWSEAVMRFEYLADDGPSAQAFTFKQAFDPHGLPHQIDRSLVREIARENEARQVDLIEAVSRIAP